MRTTMRPFFASVVCAVAGCLVVGCGYLGASASGEPTRTFQGSVSRSKVYSSLSELAADADSVVRGVAGDSRFDLKRGMPFTITSFDVTESPDAAMVGSRISIRQAGAVDYLIEGVTELLESGGEYLLFLSAFRLENGSPIEGQFVVTGEQGGWQITRKGAHPIFDGSPQLASPLSQEQIATILGPG